MRHGTSHSDLRIAFHHATAVTTPSSRLLGTGIRIHNLSNVHQIGTLASRLRRKMSFTFDPSINIPWYIDPATRPRGPTTKQKTCLIQHHASPTQAITSGQLPECNIAPLCGARPKSTPRYVCISLVALSSFIEQPPYFQHSIGHVSLSQAFSLSPSPPIPTLMFMNYSTT